MLSRRVVGMQKIPTRRSLTARLRINRLVTVRIFLLLKTIKHTTPLPTIQTKKMSKYETMKIAATDGLCR